jgi:hypothetical protein
MKKFLTFKYIDKVTDADADGKEYMMEKYVAIHLNKEGEHWVVRFPEETLNDLVALARSKGLNVLIEG